MNVLKPNTYPKTYSEELSNVFSEVPMSIQIIQAKDYVVEFVNVHYLNSFDKKTDIIGKSLFETHPELISQGIKTIIDKVFKTGIPYICKEFPMFIVKNDSLEQCYFNLTYKPLRERDGTISKLILVATDITEQVKFQLESEDAEHLYHELIYSSTSLMAIFKGESMTIVLANDAILESWGKGKDVIGKSLFEIMPEIIEQGFNKILLDVYKTGVPFFAYEQNVNLERHGKIETMHYNFVYQPQRNVNGIIEGVAVIANEVNNQALIHQKLEKNEHRFRNLVENAPNPICILKGEQMTLELANAWIYKIWHVDEKALGKPFLEIVPEMKDQPFMGYLLEVFHTGITHYGIEEPAHFVREDGTTEIFYFNFFYQPYHEDDGTRSGVMVVATDVTEQIVSRKKMEIQATMVENLLINAPAFVCTLVGPDHVYGLVNERYQALFGKRAIQGKPMMEALPELQGQGFDLILDKVYKTGEIYLGINVPASLARDKNLEPEDRFFNFSYQPMYDENNEIYSILVFGYEVTSQAIINKKIKESESHFRIIAEMMPEKVTNASPDGTVIFYNKSWLDYTGASFDELINEGWAKWIHPDDVDETHRNWNYAWQTGTDYDMELRILNHQGEYRWHISKARPAKDEDGKVKLWIGTNVDIHLQKQQTQELEMAVAKRTAELQQKNKELRQKNKEITETREKLLSEYSRSLIEASLDPLFVISPKGKITDINQAAIKVTGVMRQKLTSSNFCDYFTDPKKASEVYKEVFLKGFVTDYPLTIKDGVLTDVLFNGSIYKDEQDNVLGAVVVARDITEQKKAEQQLFDSKVIAENAKEVAENAQKIAESTTRTKQQFLSNMSHEIRTPMNAIIGFTKVMLKTELTEKQKEYLNAIELSGDALIVLINDILDLAKIEAGKMTFEQIPFKLSANVSSIMHLFEPKLQEKNIKLIKEYDKRIPEVLLGDPIRLNQVMLNLLSNAVKFTSVGKITVSIHLLEEDDKKVTVEFLIKDTGVGIKKENLNTIFESFQQATNETTRLFSGTGLGLSIVKQLLEPQGGRISVESEINIGSTFSFTLSFLKTKSKANYFPEIMQLDLEMKGINVLVVEDMALNQLLMKTLLDDFGFDCDIVDNGKLALEKLYNHPYDIILMDLQMPEMNGFEATTYIRETMKLTIPIIALTADVTTVDVGKCKQAGMNDYIAKPINEKLLYSKMVTLIKNGVKTSTAKSLKENAIEKVKCINLTYLNTRTKSNAKLMKEMIDIYLAQTPTLIKTMKTSFQDKDWKLLSSSVHKMIPSFSIMGMSPDFEEMALKIQEFSNAQLHLDSIEEMVLQLESICGQACEELEEELKRLG
jgi:PAS domain S-box-containing protein